MTSFPSISMRAVVRIAVILVGVGVRDLRCYPGSRNTQYSNPLR
jgi:hypothetical protein